jgi:pimeloyl-ACP methyl ester carboxylesterase
MKKLFVLLALLTGLQNFALAAGTDTVITVRFFAADGLEVTADLYHVSETSPVMILCHQYGWSRGEYIQIARKFNGLGYNCIAVDLRAGRQVNRVVNKTAQTARSKGISTERLDARKDIEAAINFANSRYKRNVILLGSSYSATLVLMVAKENPLVERVIAFSPGEHYRGMSVKGAITGLDKPTFLTSSKREAAGVSRLYSAIGTPEKVQFIPSRPGYHAAKALWPSHRGNEEYWAALRSFLGK